METEIAESNINFAEGILINELQAWMDGGSITFSCETEKSKGIEIEIVQRVSFVRNEASKFPGSLYLNNTLVGLKSSLEADILVGLKKARFKNDSKTTDLDREILHEIINYLESHEYIEIANKVGRKIKNV